MAANRLVFKYFFTLVQKTVLTPVNNVWTKVNSFCWKSGGHIHTFSLAQVAFGRLGRLAPADQTPESNLATN